MTDSHASRASDTPTNALMGSRHTLETLLANLPGMAFRCLNDRAYTMQFVSQGALHLTGYPAEALIGNRSVSYGDLVHREDQDLVWARVQASLAVGEPYQVVYRLQAASGELKWVWEQGRLVGINPDGLPIVEGLILDVTEQRRLEEQIGASERRFRALYESAYDAIFLMDGDRFLDCNPRTEEMFRCTREAVLRCGPLDFSPPYQADGRESREVGLERIAAAYAGTRQRFDWKHIRQDGTAFDAEVSLSRVEIDSGAALLAIVRDVSERVQAYELLEQRVAERTEELATQIRERSVMEERNRLARELHDSVSQALYGISLGAATARALLARDSTKAEESIEYVLSLAEAGLAEMRALIFELRPDSLEQEGLVAALEKQIAATAARYGIRVNSELGQEPAGLSLAEKEAFYLLGREALHNVVKHARAETVTVRLQPFQEGVSLEVNDDGVGFNPGASFPGHMGLVSMHERAASIGANLTIDSSPGKGTSVGLVRRFVEKNCSEDEST